MTEATTIPEATRGLSSIGLDPLTFIQLNVVWLLRVVFEGQKVGDLKYTKDKAQTEMWVVSERIDFDKMQKLPSIVVKMGGTSSANLALGQQLTQYIHTGDQAKVDLELSNMIFHCISEEPLEARRLAWIARSAVRGLRTVLNRRVGLHNIGDRVAIEPIAPVENGIVYNGGKADFFSAKVVVPFHFPDNWTVQFLNTVPLYQIELGLRQTRSSRITHIWDGQSSKPRRVEDGDHRKPVRITASQQLEEE